MKIVVRLLLIAVFFGILGVVIAYARGYRFDIQNQSLSSTGIVAISSYPKAAKIYVNGELKGVTDSNITLPPGNYSIEIKKDGYTNWNKQINLRGELVLTLDVLMFPLNPSLSPLTNLGIVKAFSVDQTDKMLIFTDNDDLTKDGIYLFEGGNRPLNLFSPLKLLMFKKNLPPENDFHTAEVYFSPDRSQGIIDFKKASAYLISLTEENKTLFDITNSKETLLDAWQKEKLNKQMKILETFPDGLSKIASDSFKIIAFSPTETKILYQSKQSMNLPLIIDPPLISTNQTTEVRTLIKDHIYVYDKKEDKNYEIKSALSDPNSIEWYPDSKHLIFNENKKFIAVDYDNMNKQTVYSGPVEGPLFSVTNDGSLMILVNLNPEANKFPDLYNVGIK